MKRNIDIKEISDGKLYGPNDMVKADCRGCEGCSAWGDRGLPSGRCGIQKRALRNPEAEDLYF